MPVGDSRPFGADPEQRDERIFDQPRIDQHGWPEWRLDDFANPDHLEHELQQFVVQIHVQQPTEVFGKSADASGAVPTWAGGLGER